MSLSLRTTSMSAWRPSSTPALLSASKAMPALIAPSPMMATHLRALALHPRRDRHAERGRDRGRRVRGAEGVVLALVAAREARDAAELAQRRHPVLAAGEHLVRIGLVADVPDEAVVRRVEDVVQRDRQLDRAEVRREVAAGLRHRLDDELAQLGGELLAARGATAGARRPGRGSCRGAWSWSLVQYSRATTRSASSRSCSVSAMPLPSSAAWAARRSASAWARAASRPSTVT